MSGSAIAVKREVVCELERIEQLGTWALEDGDSDVLAICDAAFTGDVAAWNEALEWWGVWNRTRVEEAKHV